jgi:RNA polymerase sigma-70 factor, ECF subfamily
MQEAEWALIERARTDPGAFGILYDRHVESVYRLAYVRLGNAAAAEDVTAEVFVKALRGIGRYRNQGKPFTCWLYQIARNAVADHFRHETVTGELPEALSDRSPSVEAQAIARDEIRHVWRLVDQLPPRQRTAMILRFRDDRSTREVAQIMGKSEAATKLLIFRAVKRLRAQVTPVLHAVPSRSVLAVT